MPENKRDLILLVVAFVVLTGVLPLLLWGPWIGYMHGMMGFGWEFMPLVFLVLIAVGACYLVTAFIGTDRSKSPLEILKERYAKSEITRETY